MDDLIKPNDLVLSSIKRKKEKTIYYGPSTKEFEKMMIPVNNKTHHFIFRLCYCAGLRIAEALALKPENIDLENREIRVIAGKNLIDRTVSYEHWEDWQKLTNSDLKLMPLKVKKNTIQKAFRRYSKKSGLNEIRKTLINGKGRHGFTIHTLRHGYALNLMKEGVPLNAIQRMLGHSNIRTTSIYTEMNPKDAIDTIRLFREKNRR